MKDPYHHGFVLHTVTTVLRDLKLTDKQPLKPKLSAHSYTSPRPRLDTMDYGVMLRQLLVCPPHWVANYYGACSPVTVPPPPAYMGVYGC